jgi:hypothetical protein
VRSVLLSAALVAVFVLPGRAEPPAPNPETLVRLHVTPAAAPKPALHYVLLPELREMNPGNPVQGYMKCFMEQQKFFFDKEAFQRREKLLTMPLKELPAQELQDYGGWALRQADFAARLDRTDWQILLRMKSEGVYVLLPEVQQMRQLASALKVRYRAEVATGRFDDALRTNKTLFAMARSLGEHPTFIGNLVGIAIAYQAIGPLEEMLEQPGSPSLYWALTILPQPLVSLDVGIEGERIWVEPEFKDLDQKAPMSPEQIQKFIARLEPLLALDEGSPPKQGGMRAWLNARNKDEAVIQAARRRLMEVGFPEERLLRFPADQVLLLDEKVAYEVRRDDLMKLLNVPAWRREQITSAPKAEKALQQALFPFEPALIKVFRARDRLEQRIGLLRHVEALRLYAFEHQGALPATLAEVSVPLPNDPFTGKPFRYELAGHTAHLRGTPPPGEEKNPGFNIHYELTIDKPSDAAKK